MFKRSNREQQGDEFAASGDWENALETYAKIYFHNNNNNAEFKLKRANAAYQLGKIKSTAHWFQQCFEEAHDVLQRDEKNTVALKLCINSLFKLENFQLAHDLASTYTHESHAARIREQTWKELQKFNRCMLQSKNKRDKGSASLELGKQTMNRTSKLSLFQRAVFEYKESIAEYKFPKSFALRNCGVASALIALEEPTMAHFEQALIYFQQALDCGAQVQPREWIEKALEQQKQCIEAMFEEFETSESSARKFVTLATKLGRGEAQTRIGAEAGDLLHKCGIKIHSNTDDIALLQSQLSLFEQAAMALRMACEPLNDVYDNVEVYAIREEAQANLRDVDVSQVFVSAQFSIHRGELELCRATNDHENIQMDGIFNALDHFRIAAKTASEKDVATEAEALSCCAKVYSVVFHDFEKAKLLARHSFDLASTCFPQNFTMRLWYKTVLDILQKEQVKVTEKEENERQPYLQQWKDEIIEMDSKAGESWQALLKHVYDKFPPGEDKVIFEGELTADNGKKALLKAITHFHPDKVAYKNDRLLQVLHEEITKRLNTAYASFKG